ncbi:hypothetical protein BDF14DRAFT_1882442 [Spinellus fusiger]|nr:hypothetical protein BDF14DRAFT_1882442 [Spinellus fusiger]
MPNTNVDVSDAPRAGRLSKLTGYHFGRSRWQSRFFVLLNSELRYYKNEHAETPCYVLDLHDVDQIVFAPTPSHPFCFRLEPILCTQISPIATESKKEKSSKAQRPWTIECQSEIDMELWVAAIRSRLTKLSPKMPHSQQQSPSTQSSRFLPSFFRKTTTSPIVDIASCPSPLASVPSCRPMNRNPLPNMNVVSSFSQRRGILLAPIVVPIPQHSHTLSDASNLSFETVSVESDIQSPEYVLAPSSGIEYDDLQSKRSISVLELSDLNVSTLDTASPTFLLYKERFRL